MNINKHIVQYIEFIKGNLRPMIESCSGAVHKSHINPSLLIYSYNPIDYMCFCYVYHIYHVSWLTPVCISHISVLPQPMFVSHTSWYCLVKYFTHFGAPPAHVCISHLRVQPCQVFHTFWCSCCRKMSGPTMDLLSQAREESKGGISPPKPLQNSCQQVHEFILYMKIKLLDLKMDLWIWFGISGFGFAFDLNFWKMDGFGFGFDLAIAKGFGFDLDLGVVDLWTALEQTSWQDKKLWNLWDIQKAFRASYNITD